MDTFLPQTAIDYPVLLKKALAPGDYSAIVQLSIPSVCRRRREVVTAHAGVLDLEAGRASRSSPRPRRRRTAGATRQLDSAARRRGSLIAAGVVALSCCCSSCLRCSAAADADDADRRRRPALDVAAPPTALASRLAPAASRRSGAPRIRPAQPPSLSTPVLRPRLSPCPAGSPQLRCPGSRRARRSAIPHHYWEVAYDRGQLGDDGVWRFPHRCRNCGLELLATRRGRRDGASRRAAR